jgi:hypothetical protein
MPSQLVGLVRQLEWSDFGTPVPKLAPQPGQSGTAAYTKTDYTYSYNSESAGGTPVQYRLKDDVRIEIRFRRPPSWVGSWVMSQSQTEQDRILKHEQVHYDLVALLARDMFIELMQLKQNQYGTAQAVLHAANQVRQSFASKMQPVQDKYDDDTEHGLKPTEQATWEGYIQTAFTQNRNPVVYAPDGATYKTPILTILAQAGIVI